MEAALRNEAYQLGLKEIHFVGQIPYQQLPTYYAAVDAVVLPSRSEVWGLTINEAMAAGRPVIATNTTGVAHDLIKDGQTGWVAIADNVPSLAQCLIACATLSVAQRKDMGRRAQEYVFIHGALQGSIRGFLKAIQMAMGVSKDTNRQEL